MDQHKAPSVSAEPRASGRAERMRIGAVAAIVVVAVGSGALLIDRSDRERRAALRARIDTRHSTASQFVTAYVAGIADREQRLAASTMGGPVSAEQFDRITRENGYTAAVLLDAAGRVLAVTPAAPKLLGSPLPTRYAHLERALTGQPAASDVVLSAAKREPIVAFAAPYESSQGRRVFSAGYPVAETPLAAFTRNAMSFATSRALLVDSAGSVIASSDPAVPPGGSLTQHKDLLAAANRSGTYRLGGKRSYVASGPVEGTPWRLVFTIETTELFAPVSGTGRLVPWAILAGFAFASLLSLVMWRRAQRARVRAAAAQLEHETQLRELALSDPLTGLSNRRAALDRLAQALARAARSGRPVTVFYLDVDHFKSINDRGGHAAGDAILRGIAERLRAAFRAEDTVARLGGDEFAVICEDLDDAETADALAVRTRSAIEQPYPFGDLTLECSASIGVVSALGGEDLETLLARADGAMYAAKPGVDTQSVVNPPAR